MKKLIALLLAAVLCFSLGACVGGTQTNSNGAQTDDSEMLQGTEQGSSQTDNTATDIVAGVAEEIVFVIHISINPEFELCLDADGYITELNCLNEDAEKAFANSNVAGLYCDTGIEKLLTAAHDSGYLVSGSEIKVNTYVRETGTSQSQIISDLTAVFDQLASVVDYSYTVNVITAGDYQSDEQTLMNQPTIDENQCKYIERDSKGRIIKAITADIKGRDLITLFSYDTNDWLIKQETTNTDGVVFIEEYIYDAKGNQIDIKESVIEPTEEIVNDYALYDYVELDENNRLIKTIETDSTGLKLTKTYEYDIDGTLLKRTEESIQNGEKFFEAYDGKGKLLETIDTSANITKHVRYYYDGNGLLSQSFTIFNDGTTIETVYQNGKRSVETWNSSDGGHAVKTFNDNEICISDIADGLNGWYRYSYYYDNGDLKEYYGFDNFERPVHSIHNTDGSSVTYITEDDGSTTTIYRDANGNETYQHS